MMSFPQILEVVVGLVLVYYVMGLVVSTVTQIINESLETRGAALEMYLKKIAGDKTLDLTNLPQIKALRPIRYANWWNVFGAGIEEKRVEKIPASTLVDAFFDLSGLSCKATYTADELAAVLNQLPESDGKRAMLAWVEKGVTDLDQLRGRASDYFNGILCQAQATFKARARSIVIILSLLVTLVLGTDTIQLAKDLWSDSALRALANEQAQLVASQPNATGDVTQVKSLFDSLSAYSLRIGWWQGQQMPAGTTFMGWAGFVGLKLAGLLITAIAVSQGSSFWYDVLKKLTGNKTQTVAVESADGG
jgi:hypothetical protein